MKTIINLGMHPFADTFISQEQFGMSEPVYPLECVLDSDSGEIKLKYETLDDDRYNLYSYSYTSSNSKVSRSHWNNYAEEVLKNISNKEKILEIGSNDGYLTEQFLKQQIDARGVDPSKKMTTIAKDRGVQTYNTLFNSKSVKTIINEFGLFDIWIANNVFNHANNPEDFIKSVNSVLKEDGTFVFELPYWFCTIRDKRFDQIYHEHVTYFTAKYSYNLLKKHGLSITKIKVVDYHGGSLRVYSKKTKNINKIKELQAMIEQEENYGLFKKETYEKFMRDLKRDRNLFMQKIYQIKSRDIPIIGIGAAAKANTFLNFYNIDNTILDYITDSSEHKKGKFTPLTRIPIVEDEILANFDEVYVLILSWNISNVLIEKIKKINNKIKFISLRS